MSTSDLRKTSVVLLGAINFIVSISVFLFLYVDRGIPIFTGLAISVSTYFALYLLAFLDMRYDYHSRILHTLRVVLQSTLSSIEMIEWNVSIDISEDGSASVTNEFVGRVNFGFPRYLQIGIWSGVPQPDGRDSFVEATDMKAGHPMDVEFTTASPSYKRMRINLDRMERGDRFHYRLNYRLLKAFFFGREDYYTYTAIENSRELNIRVAFPPNVKVEKTWADVMTKYGEIVGEVRVQLVSPQLIVLKMRRVREGNSYRLNWLTR